MYSRYFSRDACDRDVENIRLFLPDQKQQQIERAGKFADLDVQIRRASRQRSGQSFPKIKVELFQAVRSKII